MKLEGEVLVNAPRDRVWRLLNDPGVLQKHMPGCESFQQTEPNHFDAVITIGVAAIKGTYKAKVEILEQQPPQSYSIKVEGSGKPGFVKGAGEVRLEDRGAATLLAYQGDIQVGGLIARVGQRLIGGITTKMTKQFFDGLAGEAQQDG